MAPRMVYCMYDLTYFGA